MNKKILQIFNLSKEYKTNNNNSIKAVNDVSLDVEYGQCVAIVGESGCGKSTLVKLVTKIEQNDAGQILFEGKDINELKSKDLREFRKDVQMIFQQPLSIFSPNMKIGTFLMEPWINFQKLNKNDAKKQAIYSLTRVKLNESYFQKYPHQLSGGELQRVAIARAISLHPKMLICDEATSALDASIQKDILDLLKEHKKELNLSMLFICHNLALVEKFCNKVAVMYLGTIVEILNANSLKTNAKHPYTKALIDSVFNIYDEQNKEIRILKGEPQGFQKNQQGCVFYQRCNCATDQCKISFPKLRELSNGNYVACHLV